MATITKGEFVTDLIYKTYDIDIVIPEEYLPYLKIEKSVKPLPESSAVVALPVEESTWIDIPWIRVKGDSTIIYNGPGGPTVGSKRAYVQRKYVHSQEHLDAGYFSESLTKKIYRAEMQYTNGADLYLIEGQVRSTILVENISTGCSGNDNRNVYQIYYDPDDPAFINYSYPSTMTNVSMGGKWKKTEILWEDRGSGCLEYTTVTDEVISTRVWAGAKVIQTYTDAVKYKWNGTSWVYQGAGNFIIDEYLLGDVITSREYTFSGYWLFYSTQYRWLFGIVDANFDGHYDDLDDVPDLTGLGFPHPMPYTKLTLEQNFGDHPLSTSTEKAIYSNARNEEGIAFCKVNTNEKGIPIYNIQPKISCLIKSRAIVESPGSPQFDVYDNTWTQITSPTWPTGYTYAKTTTNISKKTKPIYVSEGNDVPIRLRVVLSNPFFYKEDRKYIHEE
ncbi:MAG: hypothetical protein M0R03_16940 [Novosphingobium sp.]|nr:hypothetical protein [Novosphingobium sp.]